MYLLKEICFFQGQQTIALSDTKTSLATAPTFDIKSHSSSRTINRAVKQCLVLRTALINPDSPHCFFCLCDPKI